MWVSFTYYSLPWTAGPALAGLQDELVWEAQPKYKKSLELKLVPLPPA